MVKRHIHRLLQSLPMRRCCASRSPPRSARPTASWARRWRTGAKGLTRSPWPGGRASRGDQPHAHPVVLEPIYQVEIVCPSEATAKMNALMSGRRGQILGFDTREGWDGWDVVRVQMPESEIGDLIVEVRSATAGVGSFTFKFDHMAELMS